MNYGHPGVPAHEHDELDSVESSVSSLQDDVRELESFRESTEMKLSELESDVEAAKSTADDAEGEVEHLKRRVAWLEKLVRAADLVRDADFDTFTAADRRLAEQRRLAREARSRLMPQHQRDYNQREVNQMAKARAENAGAVQECKQLLEQLTGMALGDPGRADLRTAYQKASATVDSTSRTIRESELSAKRAATALAEDDRTRKELQPTIVRGELAAQKLANKLRNLIDAALADSAALPPWFVEAMGPTAPEDGAEAWLTKGVSLLTYRLTYGVIDQLRPLGVPPAYAEDERRWGEYSKLKNEIKY